MEFYFFSDDYDDYALRMYVMSLQAKHWSEICTLELLPKE